MLIDLWKFIHSTFLSAHIFLFNRRMSLIINYSKIWDYKNHINNHHSAQRFVFSSLRCKTYLKNNNSLALVLWIVEKICSLEVLSERRKAMKDNNIIRLQHWSFKGLKKEQSDRFSSENVFHWCLSRLCARLIYWSSQFFELLETREWMARKWSIEEDDSCVFEQIPHLSNFVVIGVVVRP